jgi:two-component system, NtrC family, response regulator AtoC
LHAFSGKESTIGETPMNPSAHILVVEDKQSFRFMLQTYLETAGFKTTCVAGGTEALAVLAASEVDMVISDMVMPGMDGMVLLQEVRRLPPAGKSNFF